jgi:GxxExxY protein
MIGHILTGKSLTFTVWRQVADGLNRGMVLIDPANSELTHKIIGAAIEVHRLKGPGLSEPFYEWCFMRELELRSLRAENQRVVRVEYKGFIREEPLRFDVLVEDKVLVEAKSVERLLPIHQAQLITYMRLLKIRIGLLINFNVLKMVDGIARVYLPDVP